LAGYYRKFVKHFGIIARPLTDLLKKHSVFVWASDHEKAFQLLKTALVQAPVLVLPDFSKPFSIETDASDAGVGAVLMQDHHPIAYISKSFGPKLKGLSTYEKEFVAILLAMKHWKAYLQLGEFHIYSDQKSLSHLNEQWLHTSWQQKVFTKLLGLNYKIIYKRVWRIVLLMPCLGGLILRTLVVLFLFANPSGWSRWLSAMLMNCV
jgi:hypothetical protein